MKRRATSGSALFDLTWKTGQLAFGAQRVIAMRLARIAAGGPEGQREASLMVTEKIAALAASQRLMLKACARGDARKGATSVLALYSRRVKANVRRLGRG
ncbi:MAG: hypothetical protein ABI369_11900 [Acetobacteraceae bacterium]